MSQSYREDCNDAKAKRQGIVEQRPSGTRKKQEKKVIVESRWPDSPSKPWRKWRKFKTYATVEVAERAMENLRRKDLGSEYRLKPEPDKKT